MFDLIPMLLSSVASFLFPIFASYKALKTSDPAQLTPWLMYWVVFSCCLLVESWVSFVLTWIPFYGYLRLLFLLYLILPQTQGARILYESHVHPFLQDNEDHIDEFIASAHDRLKAAGISYLKQAIEYVKVNILGLPPSEPEPPSGAASSSTSAAQSYTSSLLARFSVPSARWQANTAAGDFYSFLTTAVATATGTTKSANNGDSVIPAHMSDAKEKMSFISAQRERLNLVLSALDREAQRVQHDDASERAVRAPSMSYDGTGSPPYAPGGPSHARDEDDNEAVTQRPPSGLSMWSALSKSKSETDFVKIEADSGAEEDDGTGMRRRKAAAGDGNSGGGSWVPWGWGSTPTGANDTQR